MGRRFGNTRFQAGIRSERRANKRVCTQRITHQPLPDILRIAHSPYPVSLLEYLPHSVSCRAANCCPWTELIKPRNAMPAPPQIQLATPTPLPAPQIKILRRQPPSNPNAEGESGKTIAQKTYAEKEEEYRLARERIFGAGGGGGSRGSSTSTSPAPPSGQSQQPIAGRIRTPDTGVLRQPKGPGEGGGFGGAAGFGNGPGLGQGATNSSMRNGNLPGSQNGVGQFPPGW